MRLHCIVLRCYCLSVYLSYYISACCVWECLIQLGQNIYSGVEYDMGEPWGVPAGMRWVAALWVEMEDWSLGKGNEEGMAVRENGRGHGISLLCITKVSVAVGEFELGGVLIGGLVIQSER